MSPESYHGPFSPEMVGVYLGIITLLTIVVKGIFEAKEKKRLQDAQLLELETRRKWEIEDRQEKLQARKSAEDAKKAASAAARLANDTKKMVEVSRAERGSQLDEIKEQVKASSEASATALNAANGHNQKIQELTEIANKALENSKVTVTIDHTEKPVESPQ